MHDKIIYTPAEFAKIFSREKSWTYRQLYNLKIDAITEFGRTMIPASQIARIESHARSYQSKGRGGQSKHNQDGSGELSQTKIKPVQAATVVDENLRFKVVRQKGMGSRAVRL